MNLPFSLAIIGCGLTGTSMLYQFINEIDNHENKTALPAHEISIIIFDRNEYLGPGVPYAAENVFPFHISNMPAGEMSIVADRPDDFVNWIDTHKSVLASKYPDFRFPLSKINPDRPDSLCLPRMIMGEYLEDRFDSAVKKAGKLGIRLSIQRMHDVRDIQDLGQILSIKAVDQNTKTETLFFSERVLLSTGHWFGHQKQPGYFPSPWPAIKLLEKIPQGSEIAVMGTSLSAIDTVLTLLSDGRFSRNRNGRLQYLPEKNSRQVTLYSRGGLLPKVRGRKGLYKNHFFTMTGLNQLIDQKNRPLQLRDLFFLLNQELEAAYDRKIKWADILSPGDDPFSILEKDIHQAQNGDNPSGDVLWQTILSQALTLLKKSYSTLSASQRLWFERDYKSVFMTYAAVIPLVNAEKLLAFMESGVLTVRKLGNSYKLDVPSDHNHFNFRYTDESGNEHADKYPFLVDARGQAASYRSNPSELAQNILSAGLVQIETYRIAEDENSALCLSPKQDKIETGGLWIDPETHQVIQQPAADQISRSKKIFAAGIMTRGQIINASMAYECAVSTNQIAKYLITELVECE